MNVWMPVTPYIGRRRDERKPADHHALDDEVISPMA
jgi:hypothetical protein